MRIAAALGLNETADADTILTAINAQTAPDPARYVPIEAVADLLKQRNSAASDNAARAADAKVQQAMNSGYLTPAMRDWAVALCTQDEARFDSFIATSTPAYAHLRRPSRLHDVGHEAQGRRPASADERAICEQLGLTPTDLK